MCKRSRGEQEPEFQPGWSMACCAPKPSLTRISLWHRYKRVFFIPPRRRMVELKARKGAVSFQELDRRRPTRSARAASRSARDAPRSARAASRSARTAPRSARAASRSARTARNRTNLVRGRQSPLVISNEQVCVDAVIHQVGVQEVKRPVRWKPLEIIFASVSADDHGVRSLRTSCRDRSFTWRARSV